jgi:hypothetical protein
MEKDKNKKPEFAATEKKHNGAASVLNAFTFRIGLLVDV